MGMRCAQGGGVCLIAQAAQATLWGLNGWVWGIVRASASVGPTRCPAHPHGSRKTVHLCLLFAGFAQLLIRPRWTPNEREALSGCVGAVPSCTKGHARSLRGGVRRESQAGWLCQKSSTVTCHGRTQAQHPCFYPVGRGLLRRSREASRPKDCGLEGRTFPPSCRWGGRPVPLVALQNSWGVSIDGRISVLHPLCLSAVGLADSGPAPSRW